MCYRQILLDAWKPYEYTCIVHYVLADVCPLSVRIHVLAFSYRFNNCFIRIGLEIDDEWRQESREVLRSQSLLCVKRVAETCILRKFYQVSG
jgi:hypothetical protein